MKYRDRFFKNPAVDLHYKFRRIFEVSLVITLIFLIILFLSFKNFEDKPKIERKIDITIETIEIPQTLQERCMRGKRFLVGVSIIVVAVSYLVYAGVRETSVYYLRMDEFAAKKQTLAGKPLRVAGRVQHGSMNWNVQTLDLRFALGGMEEATDGRKPEPLAVEFNGVLPDMFAEGRDVIVEGVYQGDRGFVAHAILTSCPSKYEPEVPAS